MATQTAQIKCINKDPRQDPYHAITHVGGYETSHWKLSLHEAIRHIENGEWEFFVAMNGRRVMVRVEISARGHKYLRTEADGREPNNLLALPECP
ncbi:hypothetical protein GCM10007036_14340 [Alsobacter metallidurans]|uniref:DUF3892 domain-containing protein n=1 Tax=Alsobacter metallidurans TaxID=340221 RepID=A0A917I5L6_9HYPH|nr:DUF3892 domain-containing protein [Alsobacter metallidurans]GGH14788.1 hypothetical protein GCM10007036_14340 [Alsobacter metallidurans]